MVDVTFLLESLSILALVCPETQGHSQLIIVGTNASFFKCIDAPSREFDGSSVASGLRMETSPSEICNPQVSESEPLPDILYLKETKS